MLGARAAVFAGSTAALGFALAQPASAEHGDGRYGPGEYAAEQRLPIMPRTPALTPAEVDRWCTLTAVPVHGRCEAVRPAQPDPAVQAPPAAKSEPTTPQPVVPEPPATQATVPDAEAKARPVAAERVATPSQSPPARTRTSAVTEADPQAQAAAKSEGRPATKETADRDRRPGGATRSTSVTTHSYTSGYSGRLEDSPEVGRRSHLEDRDNDGVPDASDNVQGKDSDADGVPDDRDQRPGPDDDVNRNGVADQWDKSMRPDTEVTADAELSGKVGPDGAEGEAKAYYRESVKGGRKGTVGPAKVSIEGSASVEGEIGAKGRVTPDRVEAEVGAFVGGKTSFSGRVEVYGVGITGWYGPQLGLGFDAKGHIGLRPDGTWAMGSSGGVALGLGQRYGFEVTVDRDGTKDTPDVTQDPMAGDGPEAELDAVDKDHDGIANHRDATPNQNDTDPTSTDRGDGPEAEVEAAERSRDSSTANRGPADNPSNGGDRGSSSYGANGSETDDSGRSGPAEGTSPSGGGHAVE